MGFDDGFAARDRQGMEHARWLAGVLAQRVEERRLVARADAAQDAEMELEIVLLPIEDAAEGVVEVAGDDLDGDIGHQIEIDLRPELADQRAQGGSAIAVGISSSSGPAMPAR